MRRLLVAAALAAAALGPAAVPAAADCIGVKYAGFCSEAGCTDLCTWEMWVYCDVPKADPACDLVDPT